MAIANIAAALRLLLRLRGRIGVFAAGICLTVAVAGLYLAQPGWLGFQDLKLYDILVARYRPRAESGLPIVVDIDAKSLAEYGQWPWPRYRIGLLLAHLRKAGVRAVGLDMLFAEPDRTSPRLLESQLLKDLKVEARMTGLPEALSDYDRVLADVLRAGPYALGYFFEFGANGDAPEGGACPLPPLPLTVASAPDARPLEDCLIQAERPVCPLATLLTAAPTAGFFNIVPDPDGILRRMPLLLGHGGKAYPSLALATVMQAYGVKSALVRLTSGGVAALSLQNPSLGERTIPLDASGHILLNYRGPGGSFPHVSAADILADRAPAAGLAGKIVFLGTSAAALNDLRATPLDRAMPGVEAHATVADMLLAGDFLHRPDWAPAVEFLGLAAAGILTAALMALAPPLVMLVPFLALGAGVWYGAAALIHRGFFVSPLFTLLVLVANFTILTFLKFWRAERQKRFIHGAFAHYVSPVVVSRIVSGRDALTLSGEEREATILFSDVRGFTSLSENLSPTQVVDLLQHYFTPMTDIITEHMGTMDKFIGDAIMAFWNAPVDVPGHRTLAVRAALAMRTELDRLNVEFKSNFGYAIKAGIGLHCGVVRVGNFGSKSLFNYTVIGDAVNLCSRLEGLTKYYGLHLLVTDTLMEASGEEFAFQEIDRVLVKGKMKPVTLFTVLTAAECAARAEELGQADEARALYISRRFPQATEAYRTLLARYDRKLYAVFAERSKQLATTPPSDDWDGVFAHTAK